MTRAPNAHRSGRRPGIAETRAAILASAGRNFAAAGLAGARTDAIAAQAGVNKALLYYYFESKERLFEAVLDEHFAEFNRQAIELLNSPGSPRAILLRYVSLHFDFISRGLHYAPLYQQLMLAGGKPLERLVKKHFAPRGEALGRLLERGMRAREFRRADGRNTAISIIALIVFYFSAAQVLQLLGQPDAYSDANLHKRKREVLDFVRYGLFVNPKATLP